VYFTVNVWRKFREWSWCPLNRGWSINMGSEDYRFHCTTIVNLVSNWIHLIKIISYLTVLQSVIWIFSKKCLKQNATLARQASKGENTPAWRYPHNFTFTLFLRREQRKDCWSYLVWQYKHLLSWSSGKKLKISQNNCLLVGYRDTTHNVHAVHV